MPFTDSGLWVPRDPRPKKRWTPSTTALLTTLSVAASLGALYVSYRGLQASNQANVIGQRAYLAISNGHIKLEGSTVSHNALTVKVEFVIRNLGNTPAQISDPVVVVHAPPSYDENTLFPSSHAMEIIMNSTPDDPDENKEAQRANKALGADPVLHLQVAPKEDLSVSRFSDWWDKALIKKKNASKDDEIEQHVLRMEDDLTPLVVTGVFHYRDVFGGMGKIEFCWTYEDQVSRDCSEEERKNAVLRKSNVRIMR